MKRGPSAERTIEYAGPVPRRPARRVSADDVFVAAVTFGVGHWSAELCTGYAARHWSSAAHYFESRGWLKASGDSLVYTMCAETVIAVWAAGVFLVAGTILRPPDSPTRRRLGWLVAAVTGVGFCWTRWAAWWTGKRWQFGYPDRMDVAGATCLAAGCAALVMMWWRPRRVPPA